MKEFKSEHDVHIEVLEGMPQYLKDYGYEERHRRETIEFALGVFRSKLERLKLLRLKEYNQRKVK